MKKINYILGGLLCSMSMFLGSCESDAPQTSNDESVRFLAIHPSEVKTKVTDTGFEQSDVIGLYLTESSAPLQIGGNEINNSDMRYDGSAWAPTNKVYWNKEKTYNAYAYYPYISSVSSVEEQPFAVRTDQNGIDETTGKNGYELSDFLWANASNIESSTDPVKLTFSHRLSVLKVQLVKSADYDGDLPDNSEIKVYVHNTVTDATIDFAAGVVTKNPYKDAKTITAKSIGNNAFAAIVVPQRVEQNLPLVEVVMKGVSYLVESRFQFKMGTMHVMNITISKNPEQIKIELGGEIQNWD